MTLVTTLQRRCRRAATLAVVVLAAAGARAETAAELLQQLNDSPHAKALDFSESEVRDYEVGLGAMRKVGGAWTF